MIVSFDSAFLMAFHLDHTAVNINGDGFAFALIQQPSKDFEIDFSQHLGCFVAEISQKSRYRLCFFDRNGKFINHWIALQQFQPFQIFYAKSVVAQHACDVVHFNFVGGSILKSQIVIDQVKNPMRIGVFQQ